ncbi:MAG: acyl-CoA thioesterase [Alphaproteobacteria bacterium]|nr:acyl-CoA thioesterase [Alphaproteobacteria bacterium]
MAAFSMVRRVAFSDTDAAGIVHFARYFVWLEDCEHAFLRSVGMPVHAVDADGERLFPRVEATCAWKAPLRFDEEATLTLDVVALRRKVVVYEVKVHAPGRAEPCAVGRTTVVFSRRQPDGTLASAPFPADLHARLAEAHAAWQQEQP